MLQKCATVPGLICRKQVRGKRERATVLLDTVVVNLQPEPIPPSTVCRCIKAAGLSVRHGGQLHEHKLQANRLIIRFTPQKTNSVVFTPFFI